MTAVVALTPVAIAGLRELARDERTSGASLTAGVIGGVGMSVGLMAGMKLRLRSARAR